MKNHKMIVAPKKSLLLALFIGVFFGHSTQSFSCNVPVFRYALERWESDMYTAGIFYDSVIDSALLAALTGGGESLSKKINLKIELVNVHLPRGKALAEQFLIPSFPWLLVQYPKNSNVQGILWADSLNAKTVKNIVDSPVRKAVVENLLRGDAAVWVFLKSGNQKKDERAKENLLAALLKASTELSIPKTAVDVDGNSINIDDFYHYDVNFSFVEIFRSDPNEQVLIEMLLGTEPDLYASQEPIVFPVFGRGRALYAILGNGIREQIIMDACRSVIAWCSCEIKDQNPGTDLLLNADWSNPAGGQMVNEEQPEITGFSEFVSSTELPPSEAASTLVAVQNAAEAADTSVHDPALIMADSLEAILQDSNLTGIESSNAQISNSTSSISRNILVTIAAGLTLIIAITLFLKSRNK